MSTPLIEVRDLKKHFPIKQGLLQRKVGAVQAVDGVSFDVMEGETLGIVGESGCGKSTTARLVTRLLEPTEGSIKYQGQDIAFLSRADLKPLRRDMQMIFQDPYSSLNPRKTVGSIIGEPFVIHRIERDEDKRKKLVQELMDIVGLNPEHYNRFPHEFSGGQRQRIGVARAIALKPKLIVADEPVSALDVSIQAQIINLLEDLQRDLGLTIIFIAHDLSVVRHVCDRVAVMYLGKIVEIADGDDLFAHPRHPVHRRAAVRRAGARSADGLQQEPSGARRRRALPEQPAEGLPLPHPLPEGQGRRLRRRRAAARAQGGRQRGRLPLPAHRRGDRQPRADRRGVAADRFAAFAGVREFPEGVRTAADAARAVGCEVGAICKSLVFVRERDGAPLLVIASGANRVDEPRLGLRKADAAFVREVTGRVDRRRAAVRPSGAGRDARRRGPAGLRRGLGRGGHPDARVPDRAGGAGGAHGRARGAGGPVLIYEMGVSVDGFIADREGAFGWGDPSKEQFRFHTAHVRELGAYLCGRRLYETMLVWDTDPSLRDDEPGAAFADAWCAIPKVVFSRTLDSVQGNARLAEAPLAEEVAAALGATDKDVAIGGAGLAAASDRARTRRRAAHVPLPRGRRWRHAVPAAVTDATALDLIETRTFGSRVVYERYRRAPPSPAR